MSTPIAAVVVDTGVFSDALSPSRESMRALYAQDLVGRKLLISFQTAAEVRYGALWRGWGEQRLNLMERHLATAVEVPPHDELTNEWAMVRSECRRAGHAFQDKCHIADLWVAATARVFNLPLITHDSGFRGVPGLDVICYV